MIKTIFSALLLFTLISCDNGENETKKIQTQIDSLRSRIAAAKNNLSGVEAAVQNFSTVSDSIKKEVRYDSLVEVQKGLNTDLLDLETSLKALEIQLPLK